MKIDIHVHASERSNCGRSSEEEIVQSAILQGLDAIVFTDHNKFIPDERLGQLNATYSPFRIYKGIEVSVPKEHVVVIGLDDDALESEDWTYEELHRYVRAEGAFMSIAHPFRYRDYINVDLSKYPPDAIETHSANTIKMNRPKIYDLIERYGLEEVCCSDAHHVDRVGLFHIELNMTPEDEKDLAGILRAGEYKCSGIQDSIDRFNEDVQRIEDIAKEIHSQGKGSREFFELTGVGESRYQQIIDGISFII